jgi:hypothetical protein
MVMYLPANAKANTSLKPNFASPQDRRRLPEFGRNGTPLSPQTDSGSRHLDCLISFGWHMECVQSYANITCTKNVKLNQIGVHKNGFVPTKLQESFFHVHGPHSLFMRLFSLVG